MWYTLGDYTLDTRRYEICRAGFPLPLQPKLFELLVYLIQHRDRVVTRQELFDTLWPEQFVSDDALERLVVSARRAVGDNGAQRAVLVALRIREQFQVNRAELTLLSGHEPAVCMAVHTGEVIVGPIGADRECPWGHLCHRDVDGRV
jgi:hypothetical protein